MTGLTEIILAAILGADLILAASSRLFHCIKVVAFQGILLGVLPLVIWNWSQGMPHGETVFVSLVNLLVKGLILPLLLTRAMRMANVRRELEPFVGYSISLFLILAVSGTAFWFCIRWNIGAESVSLLSVPTALTTMLTGLFIIIARKKAITQAIGFLIFENGITVFGTCMMLEYGLVVDLGILLDVFVLVFVMGIALFQINREFEHIDSDKLNSLGDWTDPENEDAEKEVKS